jgi:hypothetical protein
MNLGFSPCGMFSSLPPREHGFLTFRTKNFSGLLGQVPSIEEFADRVSPQSPAMKGLTARVQISKGLLTIVKPRPGALGEQSKALKRLTVLTMRFSEK